MTTERPQRPNLLLLAVSALVMLYFLWVLLLAPGERPSTAMAVLYWLVVVGNAVHIGTNLLRWGR